MCSSDTSTAVADQGSQGSRQFTRCAMVLCRAVSIAVLAWVLAMPSTTWRSTVAHAAVDLPASLPEEAGIGPGVVDADALLIPKLLLTTRVEAFGKHGDALAELPAGGDAIAYVEMKNVAYRRAPNRAGWVAKLAVKLVIRDKQGVEVWSKGPAQLPDHHDVPRRDFYWIMRVTVPKQVKQGDHTVTAVVTDLTSGNRAERSMDLRLFQR